MDLTLDLIRGVITLDVVTYREFLNAGNVMKRGFLILLACFFIASIPVFGQTLIENLSPFTAQEAADFQEQFTGAIEQFQPAGSDDLFFEQFQENFLIQLNIGVEIDALPTLLPRPVASFFKALGAWVSAALRGIGPWLGYGAVVLLIAKLAGGRGILNHFYGLTALFAIPYLLRIFDFVPFLGAALSLAGLIWGILVYIRAVQVSQEFSAGKATLITFSPVLILLLLGACLGSAGLLSLAGALAAAQ